MRDDQYLKQLGATIRKVRKQRGISIERLAERMDFDRSNLSRVELGQKNARILTLKLIAEHLDVDLKDLL